MIHVEFLPNKKIESLNIAGIEGSYGIDTTPFEFEKCREKFALFFKTGTPGFYFKHPTDRGVDVASFIKKTEIVLKQTEFSEFALTNRRQILWVEPTMFWKSCRMKRSLFTILLRAGMTYDPRQDNYEHALLTEAYLLATQHAVMRFLFGFTKYVGPSMDNEEGSTYEYRGWKHIFEAKDETTVKSWLVSPDSNHKSIPELRKALWA
jgi:hypothetical protein